MFGTEKVFLNCKHAWSSFDSIEEFLFALTFNEICTPFHFRLLKESNIDSSGIEEKTSFSAA